MAIAYRSGSSAGNASGQNLTVNKPSNTANGDILIATLYREGGTWTLPSGWAQIRQVTVTSTAGGTPIYVTTAWKRAASEGASWTFTLSTSTYRTISIAAFSGAIASVSPIDAENGQAVDNSTSPVAPTITTTVANTMRVGCLADLWGDSPASEPTNFSAGPQLGGCEICYYRWSSSGATGTIAWGSLPSSGDTWGAHQLALKPAAATAYTLSCAQSSFTLTGQTATLKAARRLALTRASYPLTGLAALLKRGYRFQASAGSLTLTGRAAGVKAARRLALARVNGALTGQSAAIRAKRLISAGLATCALSGRPASVRYGRRLSAAARALTLAGQPAGLKAARALRAAQAAFTLACLAAPIRAARRLLVASSNLVLTGAAVELAYTPVGRYSLTISPGSLSLAGGHVAIALGRHLATESTVYTLTGPATGLRATRQLQPDCAALALTGQDAQLIRGRWISLGSAAFALDGQAAGLRAAWLLVTAASVFQLDGQPLAFLLSRAGLHACIYRILAERRAQLVLADDRRMGIPVETRVVSPDEDRFHAIPFEDRIFAIQE